MAKITDPDDLNVGTEITFDLPNKTFTLVVAGNLVAKDGVTGNALWAKFVDLWTVSTYQPYPFPMNVLDARSGQYIYLDKILGEHIMVGSLQGTQLGK